MLTIFANFASVGIPELIPVLGSQPAGDRSQKPRGGRLVLLSAPSLPPSVTAHWPVPNYTAR